MTVYVVIRLDLRPVAVACFTTEVGARRYVNMLPVINRDRYVINAVRVSQ